MNVLSIDSISQSPPAPNNSTNIYHVKKGNAPFSIASVLRMNIQDSFYLISFKTKLSAQELRFNRNPFRK